MPLIWTINCDYLFRIAFNSHYSAIYSNPVFPNSLNPSLLLPDIEMSYNPKLICMQSKQLCQHTNKSFVTISLLSSKRHGQQKDKQWQLLISHTICNQLLVIKCTKYFYVFHMFVCTSSVLQKMACYYTLEII